MIEKTGKKLHDLPYLGLSFSGVRAKLRQLAQTLPCRHDPLNGDYLIHTSPSQRQKNTRQALCVVESSLLSTSCDQQKFLIYISAKKPCFRRGWPPVSDYRKVPKTQQLR